MTVARCVREVDSVEFSHWLAFNQIDPFDKADYYAAQLQSTLFNVHRNKDTAARSITDSLLFHDGDEDQETEEQRQARIAASLARRFAGAAEARE